MQTDNSEDEEDSEDEGGGAANRLDKQRGEVEKRINRRKWERRRQEILIEYESFSYHAASSAVVLFDLAWKLSQDTHQLLW